YQSPNRLKGPGARPPTPPPPVPTAPGSRPERSSTPRPPGGPTAHRSPAPNCRRSPRADATNRPSRRHGSGKPGTDSHIYRSLENEHTHFSMDRRHASTRPSWLVSSKPRSEAQPTVPEYPDQPVFRRVDAVPIIRLMLRLVVELEHIFAGVGKSRDPV